MAHRLAWLLKGVLVIAFIAAIGGAVFGGTRLFELRRMVEQRDADLTASQAEVHDLEAQVVDLDRRVAALDAVTGELRQQSSSLQSLIDQKDGTLATLTAQLSQSVPAEQLSKLQSQFDTLQQSNDALQQRLASLVPIETPELSGNALYLDRSVSNVTYTGAVCSGSMEPNITCNDLLILYRASVTDLNTGDIIYFRRQNPDCSGPLPGRFMLHRITRVIAASSGLEFETKGDALAAPDACLVPAQDVLYKLLTNVRSARIPG